MIHPYKIYGEPFYRDLENSNEERAVTNWIYANTPFGNIFIHPDFVTDGASIPWYVRWLIPKSGKWNRAALFHDYLYKYGGFWNEKAEWIAVTRQEADDIYYGLMRSRGVSKKNAQTQWTGLKAGGWVAWNKHRRNDKQWKKDIANFKFNPIPPQHILEQYMVI